MKNKQKLKIVIVAILVLTLLSAISIIFLKVNYLLGSGLVLYLTPTSKSISLSYGEFQELEFNASVNNPFYCTAECNYTFTDISNSIEIDKGNFTLNPKRILSKKYDIRINRIGSGQDIYNFQVTCKNRRTYFCLSQETDYKISPSFIIVNYNLSKELFRLKENLRANLTLFLDKLYTTDNYIQVLNRNIHELIIYANINSITNLKDDINSQIDHLVITSEKFHSLWAKEEYIKLREEFNENYSLNISSVLMNAKRLEQETKFLINIHNSILNNLGGISNSVKDISNLLPLFKIKFGDNYIAKFNETISNINLLRGMIYNNTFQSYEELINYSNAIQQNLSDKMNLSINLTLHYFILGGINTAMERDFICSIQKNCTNNLSIGTLILEANNSLNNPEIPSIKGIKERCNEIIKINETLKGIRNQTLELINNSNTQIPNSDEFISYAENKRIDILSGIATGYTQFLNSTYMENSSSLILDNVNELIPKYFNYTFETNPIFDDNADLYLRSKINLSDSSNAYIEDICTMTEENITLLQISNTTLNMLLYNSTYNITPRVNKNLSESFPICCVFKECSRCCNTFECANEPKTFPIVLVHGHSLRRSYSPDYSLDTFDKIQQRLQGEGYLNAGSLYYAHKTVNKGEWGLSGKPVTVKVTYYYDIYREGDDYIKFSAKSESIDTYALRLNDIIDVVKENTGKPKVNIIAFSMGGLVARKFLQIYGDSSVYKLITISTPHKGIVGKVADLCPVIGESKECDDMQTGSLFLNKLNDHNKQPKNVKIYNILGRGCKTNKQDSDGIILTEYASLKGIVNATEFFVNGTCQVPFTFLHREIIDIDEYPEVYEYVVRALRD